ncbi:MAG: Kelch repeat-containing protein [Terriglobales bacterium]
MIRARIAVAFLLGASFFGVDAQTPQPDGAGGPWSELKPMFEPVSNNAVASLRRGRHTLLFTFMGMGPGKAWNAITNQAWMFDTESGNWTRLRSVPGLGRLAASAASVGGRIYVLGGYTVDAAGNEISVPNLDVYDPKKHLWRRGADIPVPVDDSVVGVYRDRYLFVVGGWSQKDNVRNVQVYDTKKNSWSQATPLPGTPVFGHSGGLVGDTIVYVDGAYPNAQGGTPRYLAAEESWMGRIDGHDPARITWTRLPGHPGRSRYRMAAGVWGGRIIFSGGTDNPYNYNGVGYDGRPSEPVAAAFAWNLARSAWETLPDNPRPTMDHRGLLPTHEGLVALGGMEEGQRVTARVTQLVPAR